MDTFGTLTGNASGNWVFCDGPFSVIIKGTWGTAQAVVEIKSRGDGDTSVVYTSAAMNSDATAQNTYYISGGKHVRVTVSGATGGESLKWEFFGYRLGVG